MIETGFVWRLQTPPNYNKAFEPSIQMNTSDWTYLFEIRIYLVTILKPYLHGKHQLCRPSGFVLGMPIPLQVSVQAAIADPPRGI